jgi:hypothetical protein
VISLTRETVAALVSAGISLAPLLAYHRHDADAWSLVQALDEAEAALLDDQREDEGGARPSRAG